MSFFTFHISIFFSASLACGALIMSEGEDDCRSGSRFCLAKVSCLESPEFLVSTLVLCWYLSLYYWNSKVGCLSDFVTGDGGQAWQG